MYILIIKNQWVWCNLKLLFSCGHNIGQFTVKSSGTCESSGNSQQVDWCDSHPIPSSPSGPNSQLASQTSHHQLGQEVNVAQNPYSEHALCETDFKLLRAKSWKMETHCFDRLKVV